MHIVQHKIFLTWTLFYERKIYICHNTTTKYSYVLWFDIILWYYFHLKKSIILSNDWNLKILDKLYMLK
jgi:hypothetical protein